MAEINLRKLNRQDLLELLLQARRENERLQQEVDGLHEKYENMNFNVEEIGSIADASLRLSGVFEAAQKAADQYIQNVQLNYREQVEETDRLREEYEAMSAEMEDMQRQRQQIEEETRQYCEEMIRRAKAQAGRLLANARAQAAGE